MSRSLNVTATLVEVLATCEEHNAPVSTAEELRSGGTRLVLKSVDDVGPITAIFGAKIIKGPVTRMPLNAFRR